MSLKGKCLCESITYTIEGGHGWGKTSRIVGPEAVRFTQHVVARDVVKIRDGRA